MSERLRRLAQAGDAHAIEALAREELRRGAVVRRKHEPQTPVDCRGAGPYGFFYKSGGGLGDGSLIGNGFRFGDGLGDGDGDGDGDGYGDGNDSFSSGGGFGDGHNYGNGHGDNKSRS